MYAVGISKKSLDLIATNNGGVKPEIVSHDLYNIGSYFILPTNPNDPAEILSADDFFDKYEFVNLESDTEFRPIQPIGQFPQRTG